MTRMPLPANNTEDADAQTVKISRKCRRRTLENQNYIRRTDFPSFPNFAFLSLGLFGRHRLYSILSHILFGMFLPLNFLLQAFPPTNSPSKFTFPYQFSF